MRELASTEASPQRKLLGAFYTESETASAIARIAVQRRDQAVLDPCFGGCAFLEAVRERFVALGKSTPMERVYGVDVDPTALEFLRGVRGARAKQFLVRNFLDVVPGALGDKFDVVVGNPPFVRHHLLSESAVDKGQAQISPDLRVPRSADSWVYFFHHALRFLRAGGCLAMVLPGALLNASYAASVRQALALGFRTSDLFLVRKRLFADALESPVIVIARGLGERPQGARISVVDSPREIGTLVRRGHGQPVDLTEKTGPWRLALLSKSARATLSGITRRPDVAQLGSIATVRIGVVTGANNFFVLSAKAAASHRLPKSALHPILSSAKQLRGLELKVSDLRNSREANERVLLLSTKGKKSAAVEAYLNSSEAALAQKAYKCRIRETWHRIEDDHIPDAFLSYVIDCEPRLVLNRARSLCTNAVHRLWWRGRTSMHQRLAWTLSIGSSLGGLSAELYGRACGGGALKLEPTEAAALWMPASFRQTEKTARAFELASEALRDGDWKKSRDVADRAILRDQMGLTSQEIGHLRDAHDQLLEVRFSVAARKTPRAPG